MTNLDDVAAGGPAFALMTAWLSRDYSSQHTLASVYSPTELLDSAVAFAGHLASRTAQYLTDITGQHVTDDSDGGLLRVIEFAVTAPDMIPASPETPTHVLHARDSFLSSLAESLRGTSPDEEHRSYVTIQFWPGWDGDDFPFVLAGIAMALTRLFHLSILPELTATEDDGSNAPAIIHAGLDEVRRGLAAAA